MIRGAPYDYHSLRTQMRASPEFSSGGGGTTQALADAPLGATLVHLRINRGSAV